MFRVVDYCRREHPNFRVGTGIVVAATVLFWMVAVAEICDWGALSGWWRTAGPAQLERDGRLVRVQHELRDAIQPADRLVTLNGRVVDAAGWNRELRLSHPGDKWHLRLMRDGKEREILVTLGEDGWRHFAVFTVVLVVPLLLVRGLTRPALKLVYCADTFWGFVLGANLVLSLVFGHLPFGPGFPGMFAAFDGFWGTSFVLLSRLATATGPAACLYFAWRWPEPASTGRGLVLLMLSASVIFGILALAGVLLPVRLFAHVLLITWAFRHLLASAKTEAESRWTSGLL